MSYPTEAHTLLGNIRANLEAIRAHVGDRLVLAAVKADAYGHGAVEVCRMIERTGAADWLGVATVDEAVQLRDAGLALPILKLSPTRGRTEVGRALAAGLTLTVVDASGRTAEHSGENALGTRAASVGDSWDQNLSTVQPKDVNRSFVSASRRRFASIFCRQNSAFCFGHVACSGQPCQKQPSTKTAIFRPGNATSATGFKAGPGLR